MYKKSGLEPNTASVCPIIAAIGPVPESHIEDRVPGIGGSWHRGIRRAYTPFKRHILCAGADSTKMNEDKRTASSFNFTWGSTNN
ncbi:hypothetical protein RU639_005568 [Aspergillus parasiticus]